MPSEQGPTRLGSLTAAVSRAGCGGGGTRRWIRSTRHSWGRCARSTWTRASRSTWTRRRPTRSTTPTSETCREGGGSSPPIRCSSPTAGPGTPWTSSPTATPPSARPSPPPWPSSAGLGCSPATRVKLGLIAQGLIKFLFFFSYQI